VNDVFFVIPQQDAGDEFRQRPELAAVQNVIEHVAMQDEHGRFAAHILETNRLRPCGQRRFSTG
jgi:hypothetical protein